MDWNQQDALTDGMSDRRWIVENRMDRKIQFAHLLN